MTLMERMGDLKSLIVVFSEKAWQFINLDIK